MNTYDYEDALFRIDNKLRDFRDLKEKYIVFNSRNAGNPIVARDELNDLIDTYQHSGYEMFRNFDHFRNRFLYATRSAPILNGSSDHTVVIDYEEEEF